MSRADDVQRKLRQISDLYAEIDAIQAACEHDYQPSTPEHPDASSPLCAKCGLKGFGWWCPTSPTRECVYSHSFDRCDYCGNPEERK